jgi:hypothetical protein
LIAFEQRVSVSQRCGQNAEAILLVVELKNVAQLGHGMADGQIRNSALSHSLHGNRIVHLFDGGELIEGDKLSYVNGEIKTKMLESDMLKQHAANKTKEQFSQSLNVKRALDEAIIAALEAYENISRQAMNSDLVQEGLMDVLLGPAKLYEALRTASEDDAGATGK